MSSGIYVKFSTFNGGSVNVSYRDQFEAARISWGVDVPLTLGSGGIAGVGKSTPRAMELKLPYQVGFTDIGLASSKGTVIPTINIELVAPAGGAAPKKIMRYDLTTTYITSFGLVDDTGVGEDLLTVTLAPAKVVWSQFIYNGGGTLTATKTATLDFSRNTFS
jgi:type VI protein secretion system component Hcp